MNITELIKEALKDNFICNDMDICCEFTEKIIFIMKAELYSRKQEILERVFFYKDNSIWDRTTNKYHHFWEGNCLIDGVLCKGTEENLTKLYKDLDAYLWSTKEHVILGIGELGSLILGCY